MWYPVTGKNSSLHPTLCVSVSVSIQWTQISSNHNAQKLHGITKQHQMLSLTYTNDMHEIHFYNVLRNKIPTSNYEYILYKHWCILYEKSPTFFQPAPNSKCSNYTQLIHQVQCWWQDNAKNNEDDDVCGQVTSLHFRILTYFQLVVAALYSNMLEFNFQTDAYRTANFQPNAFLYLLKRQLNDYFLITFY
jgi:hypothetical protein